MVKILTRPDEKPNTRHCEVRIRPTPATPRKLSAVMRSLCDARTRTKALVRCRNAKPHQQRSSVSDVLGVKVLIIHRHDERLARERTRWLVQQHCSRRRRDGHRRAIVRDADIETRCIKVSLLLLLLLLVLWRGRAGRSVVEHAVDARHRNVEHHREIGHDRWTWHDDSSAPHESLARPHNHHHPGRLA